MASPIALAFPLQSTARSNTSTFFINSLGCLTWYSNPSCWASSRRFGCTSDIVTVFRWPRWCRAEDHSSPMIPAPVTRIRCPMAMGLVMSRPWAKHDRGSERTDVDIDTSSGSEKTCAVNYFYIFRTLWCYNFRLFLLWEKLTCASGTKQWVAHPPLRNIPMVLQMPPALQKWQLPPRQALHLLQPLFGSTATLAPTLKFFTCVYY